MLKVRANRESSTSLLTPIERNFDGQTFARGLQLARSGSVLSLMPAGKEELTYGKVRGSHGDIYAIVLHTKERTYEIDISGECSCPVGYNCKHIAAAAIHLYTGGYKQPESAPAQDAQTSSQVLHWLRRIEQPEVRLQVQSRSTPERVIAYIVSPEHTDLHQTISPVTVPMKRDGAFGKPQSHNAYSLSTSRASYVTAFDQALGLSLYHLTQKRSAPLDQQLRLMDDVMMRTISTGRAFLQSVETPALRNGEARPGSVIWRVLPDGSQQLAVSLDEAADKYEIIAGLRFWYVERETGVCGPIDVKITLEDAAIVLTAPKLSTTDVLRAAELLAARGDQTKLPQPANVLIHRKNVVPVPRLFVHPLDDYSLGADLAFDYDGDIVSIGDSLREFRKNDGANITIISRDTTYETEKAAELLSFGFEPDRRFDSSLLISRFDAAAFIHVDVPRLRAEGWQIEIAADLDGPLIDTDSPWQADLGENGSRFFMLDLGILVDNERLAILPIVIDILRRLPEGAAPSDLQYVARNGKIYVTLEDGRTVALPLDRTVKLLQTLVELNDDRTLIDGALPVSLSQVLSLAGAAPEQIQLTHDRLRTFAERLRNTQGVKPVKSPATLKATLRHYQSEGLAWLQFLRTHEIGGILADDMGLGKTIQTLAHLLVEKKAGRLDKPALIVMPTSLLPNWQAEAKRFAPSLKVLPLHGLERAQEFSNIEKYDVVLTTYPLLTRDEILQDIQWHIVILDEAHYIKNYASKTAVAARELTAQHRLCLTGTPMENHVGELWSLFEFLMPGLLHDQKNFSKYFRNPIEKKNDVERRSALSRRVLPFMLRRTKDLVAGELPAKTEIRQGVDLAPQQRDLYETVRIAMDKRVRDQIAKKGIAQSRIVVLDALLKLRQVCCDPRLVKIPSAAKVKQSAKLEALLEMVENLVDENRHMLIFSQFTSMLALIEKELDKRHIAYVKLTGMTKDRKTPVEMFQTGAVPIFLISLKAGGTGLNLTAADTVIHYDPWWNPAVEQQATDRAHRLGQTKPVFVYKFVANGSVEERILEIQERKGAIAQALFDPERASKASFSKDDIDELFQPLI